MSDIDIEVDASDFESEMLTALNAFYSTIKSGTEYSLRDALITKMLTPQNADGVNAVIARGDLQKTNTTNRWVNSAKFATSLQYRFVQSKQEVRCTAELPAKIVCIVKLGKSSPNFKVEFENAWAIRILDSFMFDGSEVELDDTLSLLAVESTDEYFRYTLESKDGDFETVTITARFKNAANNSMKIRVGNAFSVSSALLTTAARDSECWFLGDPDGYYLYKKSLGSCYIGSATPNNSGDQLLGKYESQTDAQNAMDSHPDC